MIVVPISTISAPFSDNFTQNHCTKSSFLGRRERVTPSTLNMCLYSKHSVYLMSDVCRPPLSGYFMVLLSRLNICISNKRILVDSKTSRRINGVSTLSS